VQAALEGIDQRTGETADFLADIAAIISPSGQEHERAAAVAERMREIGLLDVRLDDTPNAVGIVPGASDRVLVFVSTLDDLGTVPDHQRAAPHPPRHEGDRVVGPGTNTSSTTAAMLAAAQALVDSGIEPAYTIVFAAVAQEETGLVGMKAVYEEMRDRAVGFVDILGDGRSISYGALGIHWWKVVVEGPPGHSLGGGLPNVNQAIGRAVDRILQIPLPDQQAERRTVLNIAQIHSGEVYNHKPATGWFSLDIRSLDEAVIAELEAGVDEVLSEVAGETGLNLMKEPFQITPGGQIEGALESDLVQTSIAISEWMGFEPRLSNSGSSNMNVAVGGGTLAIGLGGGRGEGRATPEEYADVPAMIRTAKHVVLLATTLR
jgi:acetylornithine deacetylase/succinyl-diaminopimelate desuccinylase-like protein